MATFFGCLYAGAIDVPAYLEMARAAVEKHGRQGTLEIRDAFFLAPLALRDDEIREAGLKTVAFETRPSRSTSLCSTRKVWNE